MQTYESELEFAADHFYQETKQWLNEKIRPWWEVMDKIENINDDVFAVLGKSKRNELLNHPNVYNGSSAEWETK